MTWQNTLGVSSWKHPPSNLSTSTKLSTRSSARSGNTTRSVSPPGGERPSSNPFYRNRRISAQLVGSGSEPFPQNSWMTHNPVDAAADVSFSKFFGRCVVMPYPLPSIICPPPIIRFPANPCIVHILCQFRLLCFPPGFSFAVGDVPLFSSSPAFPRFPWFVPSAQTQISRATPSPFLAHTV